MVGACLGEVRAIDALHPPSLRSDSTCRFLTDWHWTNRALRSFSLPCPPPTGEASRGERLGGPSYSNSVLIGFQDFLFSHSRPWIGRQRFIYSLGLRDAGRETRRVGNMAAAAAGVGRLEEEALRRKERLKALREKTGRKVRNAERESWLR